MHDFYSASRAYGEPGHAREAGRLVRREHSALLPNGENPRPPRPKSKCPYVATQPSRQ